MKPILFATTLAASSIIPLHAVDVTQSGQQVSIVNSAFSLTYDLQSGTWSATDLATRTIVFAKARFTVDEAGWQKPAGVTRAWRQSEVTDDFGKGRTLTISETPGGGYAPVKSLHLTVYDNQPFAALGFSVTNQRAFPMRVARVGVLDKAAFLPGKKLTHPQVLRGGAGAQKNHVENQAAIDTHNSLLITGKLDGQRLAFVAGGLRYREFLRRLVLDDKKLDCSPGASNSALPSAV